MHSRFGDRLFDKELWRATPDSIARAWLISIPIALIPFLPGQSIISGVLGFTFRANILLCMGLPWVTNPATSLVHLPAAYFAGRLVQGHSPTTIWQEIIARDWKQIFTSPALFARDLIPLFLGSVVLGAVLGVIGYFMILAWGRRHAEKVAAKKRAASVTR